MCILVLLCLLATSTASTRNGMFDKFNIISDTGAVRASLGGLAAEATPTGTNHHHTAGAMRERHARQIAIHSRGWIARVMEHRTRTRRDSRRLVKFLATFCLYDCSLGVRGQTPVPQNGVRPREIGVQLSWATDFAMALPSILFHHQKKIECEVLSVMQRNNFQ